MSVRNAKTKAPSEAGAPAKVNSAKVSLPIEKPSPVPVHRSAQAPLRTRALKTKQHLIDTAMALFLQRGYVATTIEHIADAAGVSRASFYTYFSSKPEIMVLAGHECRRSSWELFEELGTLDPKDLVSGMSAWVAKYFKFLEKNGGYLLMWQQAAMQDRELRKPGMRGSQKGARIMADSLKALGIDKPEDDLLIRSMAILSLLDRFWYHWWIVKAPFKRKQVFDNLSAMLVAAIRA